MNDGEVELTGEEESCPFCNGPVEMGDHAECRAVLSKMKDIKPPKQDEQDDHYVADPHNAHIDTSDFENWLNKEVAPKPEKAGCWPIIYEEIVRRISGCRPSEPADDTLICRYLTPANYVRFIGQTALYFTPATAFNDRFDCSLPDDYNMCVLGFLQKQGIKEHAQPWEEYADKMRARWRVSCWTELDEPYDDHLLWHRYAGGDFGIGITIRYHKLRDHLDRSYQQGIYPGADEFTWGKVAYIRDGNDQGLRHPPFKKRRIFKSEKEIRFVFRTKTEVPTRIDTDIAELKQCFRLRFSPDVPRDYKCSVREVWKKWGGVDGYPVGDH